MIPSSISDLVVSKSTGKSLPEIPDRSHKTWMSHSAQIANFFEPAVQSIIEAIEEQIRKAEIAIKARSIVSDEYQLTVLAIGHLYGWRVCHI